MDQPIRILQRPILDSNDNSDEKEITAVPSKSREQREADYAAARLRILGAEKPDLKKVELVTPNTTLPSKSTENEKTNRSLVDFGQEPRKESDDVVEEVQTAELTSLSEKSSLKKKNSMPPSLMSIKTNPTYIDPLNEFKVMRQPLLSSPNDLVFNGAQQPNQNNSQNVRAVVSASQKIQGQNRNMNLRSGRHSDTNLCYCQFPRHVPGYCGLQAPPVLNFPQQQSGFIANWDASNYPQPCQTDSNGKQLFMNGKAPSQLLQDVPNSMGRPGVTGNDAAMVAAVLAAAVTASNSNVSMGPSGGVLSSRGPPPQQIPLLGQFSQNQLQVVNNNNGILNPMANHMLNGKNTSVNSMLRSVHSQPNFQQPHHMWNMNNYNNTGGNQQQVVNRQNMVPGDVTVGLNLNGSGTTTDMSDQGLALFMSKNFANM